MTSQQPLEPPGFIHGEQSGVNDKSKKLVHSQITQLEFDRGSRNFEEELVEYSSIEDVNEAVVDEFRQLLGTTVSTEKLLKARGFLRESSMTSPFDDLNVNR